MTTPYSTSKPKNNIDWVPYHPIETFPELLPPFETSEYSGFADDFSDNYSFGQFLDHSNDPRQHQWQDFHDSPLPPSSLQFQVLDNFALQEIPGEPKLHSSFNETDSSTESPLLKTPILSTSVTSVENPNLELTPNATKTARRVSNDCSAGNSPASQTNLKKHKRKQTLSRSKLGCWICRIKHLKCDETKPTCKNCVRFGIRCDYSEERPEYVSNRELRRKKLDEIITKKRRRSQASPSSTTGVSGPAQGSADDIDESKFSKTDWFAYFNDS